MPISKTDFVRGLQCEKMLWLDAHCPQERIIPPEVQAKLDAGNDFGDKAMGIFGAFTETTCFREDGRLYYAGMIEKTKALLAAGENVICEAAFTWYGNYCAADILRRDGEKYALYEVKNTFFVRNEFITDLGFQRLLLRKNGVPLSACFLILRGDEPEGLTQPKNMPEIEKEGGHVRVEYVEHDNFRYKIVDVSKAAARMERVAEKQIFELGKLKRKDVACPNVGIGEHCQSPYPCWYYDFCQKHKSQVSDATK
jgi:hypothetical protein